MAERRRQDIGLLQNMHNSELVDEMEKARQELQKWTQERLRTVDEIKKRHVAVMARGQGEVTSLQQQIKTAEAAEKNLRQELADEDRELKRLKQMLKKLKEKENMCPQELEQRKRQIEKQQQKVAEKEKQLSARQTELSQSLQKLTQNVELYRERLGLDLQRVDVNQLRFIFIYIDPANPKRQFSVDLYLDDSTDLYRVENCKPPVEGLVQMEAAINAANGDLFPFVVAIRKKFKESVLRRSNQ